MGSPLPARTPASALDGQGGVPLRPDILWRDGGGRLLAVADAKYKAIDVRGLRMRMSTKLWPMPRRST